MQRRVETISSTPPLDAPEGACFLISQPASGEWAGQEDHIAARIGGEWHFTAPQNGMAFFDADTGKLLYYNLGWQSPIEPSAASGGTTVDVEARQVLGELIEALKIAGVFPNS